jgi:hypothetical protein
MGEDESLEPLPIDANLWSHRDLLERIISRHFRIIEEASGVDIGWQVELANHESNPTEQLDALNGHLRPLSWIALLQDGSPYDLIILPEPPLGDGLSNGQMIAVWSVFMLFTTLSAGAWLQLQQPSTTLLDGKILKEALLWFSLPLMLTLLIASDVRRRIGLAYNVNLGHHMPLAAPFMLFPSNPIWPFSIIGFLSQRRMDLIPFRNRYSLALISSVGPILMIAFGTIFTVLGFMRTSLVAPSFESTPIFVEPSSLAEIILAFVMPSNELALRSAWLHPLGLAGVTLTTFGWILLLPLPGFPGDRILTGIIGPDEMHEGGTQTQLFIGILVAGMFVLYYDGFLPWLLLLALGAWRRFSPEMNAPPFVLNEIDGFDSKSKRNISVVVILALLIGGPGLVPVGEIDDWDAGLDTSAWPTSITYSPNQQSVLELPLNTIGVVPMDIEFQFYFEGYPGEFAWDVCQNNGSYQFIIFCEFNEIGISSESSLSIGFEAPTLGSSVAPFNLVIHWLDGVEMMSHEVRFESDATPSPANMSWAWNGDSNSPEYCIDLNLDEEKIGNLTIDSPLFSFEGESQIPLQSGDSQTVCIDGEYGAGRTVERLMGQSRDLLAPTLVATLDDGTVLNWDLTIENQFLRMHAGTWPASEIFDDQASYLILMDRDAHPFCPFEVPNLQQNSSLIAGADWNQKDENGTWVWNLSEIPMGLHTPDIDSAVNGTIIIPNDGKLVRCFGWQLHESMLLESAPQTITSFGGNDFAGIQNSSITNYGSDPIFIEIQRATFGTTDELNLISQTLSPGESWVLDIPRFDGNETIQHIVWLEPQSDRWVLHAVTHCIIEQGCMGGGE